MCERDRIITPSMSACPPNANEGSFSFLFDSFFHHVIVLAVFALVLYSWKWLQDINTPCSLLKTLKSHEKAVGHNH